MARQVEVQIVGDSSKFTKSIDDATGKAGKFKSVLSGLGVGIGLGVFDVAKTAIGDFVGILGSAQDAYRQDQASQAQLGQALLNNIPNWNGNVSAIEQVIAANQRLGFADDEQRAVMAKLVGETHNVADAQTIMSAAMDLARLKNIDLSTATDALIKAHNGNYKGLKDVGVELGKNATFTDALAQVQKIAGGQAEAYANTSSGKVAASQLKVGEAMEKLGGIVDKISQVALPILADAFSNLIDWISQAYDAVQPFIEQLSETLGPVLETLGKIFTQVFNVVIVPLVQKAGDLIGIAFGAIGTAADVMGKAVGLIFDALGTGITILRTAFDGLSSFVSGVFNGIVGVIRGAVNAVIDVINVAIDGINAIPDIDVGDVHIGIPYINRIPKLHKGGIVPGAAGSESLAILQAGERVIPAGKASGNLTVNVQINGVTDPNEVARQTLLAFKRELSRQGMTL